MWWIRRVFGSGEGDVNVQQIRFLMEFYEQHCKSHSTKAELIAALNGIGFGIDANDPSFHLPGNDSLTWSDPANENLSVGYMCEGERVASFIITGFNDIAHTMVQALPRDGEVLWMLSATSSFYPVPKTSHALLRKLARLPGWEHQDISMGGHRIRSLRRKVSTATLDTA
jgi:hypothetical protein